jgi:hypothetical protein
MRDGSPLPDPIPGPDQSTQLDVIVDGLVQIVFLICSRCNSVCCRTQVAGGD